MDDYIISIIVPVYNSEQYLEKCLLSIINNTIKNVEIICVNDGSTDGSLEILRRFQKSDSRIKIIEQENRGRSIARNVGFEASVGNYICFIDSDDFIETHYLEYLKRAIDEQNTLISQCGFIRVFGEYEINYNNNYNYNVSLISSNDLLKKPMIWARMYRRELIWKLRFEEKEEMEDVVYSCCILLENPDIKIAFVNVSLYFYNQRKESSSCQFTTDGVMGTLNRILDMSKETSASVREKIVLHLLKLGLSKRYLLSVAGVNKNARNKYSILIKKCLCLKKKDICFFIYAVFFTCPFLYRIYRIIMDKTLLDYEKIIKVNVEKGEEIRII